MFTLEKLRARIPAIAEAAVRVSSPIADLQTCAAPGPVAESTMAPAPAPDYAGWQPLAAGQPWGGAPGADPQAPRREIGWGIPADGGGTHWLRATLRVPEAWRGQSVHLALAWEGRDQSSLEAIVYLGGQALSGLDSFHRSALLPAAAHTGEHELLIRCYTPYRQPFGGLSLQLRDETIFQLGQAMRALHEAAQTFGESAVQRHTLLTSLNNAYNTLDLREGWQSERFAASARAALEELGVASWEKQPPTPNSKFPTPTIVATGHAHLDVAWLWPLWRTRQKVAHTVANALHLMERYPDYHFSMSQPQVYAYLKRDDPALYARMRERIAEGRFEPVGMMWLEPDCNVTSGESLVRQLAQGARFFAEEFGVHSRLVWLPDVFGYSAALPQIMRGCGISTFMTTKISWNQFNRMPNDTFRWRGIDGSAVLTHFITASADKPKHPADAQFYTYVGRMSGQEAFGLWEHYRQKPINQELLYTYGWGDGGGGPTEEMLEAARALDRLPGFPNVRLGRVDQFFERLYARVWDDPQLPTWAGELYLEYHRGTYTGQARAKQQNRQAELLFREAEWLNAWAVTLGAPSRQDALDEGWRSILLNQFHDILPGSSIAQVYADSNADYAEVRRVGKSVRDVAAAAVLAGQASSTSENKASKVEDSQASKDERLSSILNLPCSVVWNSLPWERREVVQLDLPAGAEPPTVTGADGAHLSSQLVDDADGHALLVETTVPSYGYTTLSFAAEAQSQRNSSILNAQHSTLENADLRLELDAHGEIASLLDKRAGRELILPGATANQLVAYEDRPLQWDAWDIDIFYEQKPYPVREILDWRVAESGPLRATVAIVRRFGQSTITQRISLWRDSRRVDFATEVDWHERQTLLRALFPLEINADRATCEIQFGAVERPTHRNTSWDLARFEVCAQRWVDISESGYGVALLNDSKYGHSLHGSTLGLSLLKGAIFPDPNADRGRHRFTYSLLPHMGDWRAAQVVRRAYELNAPLFARASDGPPAGGARVSFLSTPTEHIVVETVKVADDGDGLIVRLYEAHNQRGLASLRFGRAVASAVATDLLEREVGPVEVAGDEVRFAVRPFEIKTLRIRFA